MIFDDYENCQECTDLYKLRSQIVWGHGNEDADLMFVAEGPGEREDIEGEPFKGESGVFLDQFLEQAGIDRENVYITNTVLCRPSRQSPTGHGLTNRPPTKDEIARCLPRLQREVVAIDPKVLVAIGDVAATALAGKRFNNVGIKKSRGKMTDIYIRTANGIVLTYAMIPIFHPSYLLRTRSQEEMANTVIDLQLAMAVVNRYKATVDTVHV